MTITLELKPEEVTALTSRARAEGSDIQAVLHSLVAQIAPPPPKAQEKPELTEKQQTLADLLQTWRQEDDKNLAKAIPMCFVMSFPGVETRKNSTRRHTEGLGGAAQQDNATHEHRCIGATRHRTGANNTDRRAGA